MAGKTHISSPIDLKGSIDPSAAGAAAPIGCLFRRETDGRLWVKFDNDDTDWRELITTATNGTAVLFWGCDTVGSAADARFLPPGYETGLAPTTDTMQLPCPRAGTLRNLFARHNGAGGTGPPVTYTVFVNGIATAITCALATGAIGQASDAVNTVAVNAGDRISIQASKAAMIGAGIVNVQVTLEVA